MDTFDDTLSPLPEESGTEPAQEAVPEAPPVPEESAAPRSPYEDSPYESFYDTHAQPQPQERKSKRKPKLPPFCGTVALVAAGCLITGLVTVRMLHRHVIRHFCVRLRSIRHW